MRASPAVRIATLSLALAFAGASAAGEIYEWTDASGTKQFTTKLGNVPPDQRSAAQAKAEARAARRAGSSAPPASAAPAPGARGDGQVAPSRLTADAVALFRERLLQPGGAAARGLDLKKPVQAVLMETGYENGAGSLVALENGGASLYFSNGGGVVGGESIPSVNAAARRMCEKAAKHLTGPIPQNKRAQFPLPANGEVNFLILSPDGVRVLSTSRAAAESSRSPMHELFMAGHEVITGLREASEKQGH
jgi:hypothetical protein